MSPGYGEIFAFGTLTPQLNSELVGDEQDPFESRGITLEYRPKDRYFGLRDDLGRLIAVAGLVVVEVEVGHQRFPVVGLGGVLVNAQHRGRGLARRVVGAALAKARDLGPPFVVLFCHEDRAGLYRKFEFDEVMAEVVVQQPAGAIPMHLRTMWRPLRPDAKWPAGKVVVHSLPF